jgi:AcrR family transcriptional regulator
MSQVKGKAVSAPEETRERLISAAVKLFAEKGFDGTSVKELADAAGANVSLVSYHFGGKEGLYRHCLEQFGRERLEVARRLLQPVQSLEEFKIRLEMFVTEIFACHVADSSRARIIHRECDMDTPIALEVFRETFLKVFETLKEFIAAAQEKNIIRSDLESHLTTASIFGCIVNFMRSDRLTQKFYGHSIQDSEYRKKVIHHLIQICLFGLIGERSQ